MMQSIGETAAKMNADQKSQAAQDAEGMAILREIQRSDAPYLDFYLTQEFAEPIIIPPAEPASRPASSSWEYQTPRYKHECDDDPSTPCGIGK